MIPGRRHAQARSLPRADIVLRRWRECPITTAHAWLGGGPGLTGAYPAIADSCDSLTQACEPPILRGVNCTVVDNLAELG